MQSSRNLMPRVSTLPPEMERSSLHVTAPLCASFIDTDSTLHSGATPSSADSHPQLFSDSDDTETMTGKYFQKESRQRRRKHGLEDETQWGYLKEEEIQAHINSLYGFVLKLVDNSGTSCSVCHWLKGCTGCVITPDDMPLYCMMHTRKIAIDWNPVYLSNHYHQIMYDNTITHNSVEEVDPTGRQNILLSECLQKYIQTEILQGEQRIYCDHVGSEIPCHVVQNGRESLSVAEPLPSSSSPHHPPDALQAGAWRLGEAPVQHRVPSHGPRSLRVRGSEAGDGWRGGLDILEAAGWKDADGRQEGNEQDGGGIREAGARLGVVREEATGVRR